MNDIFNRTFIALCKSRGRAWRSLSQDDTEFFLGIGTIISFTLPIQLWDACDFAEIKNELHTIRSEYQILDRLKML